MIFQVLISFLLSSVSLGKEDANFTDAFGPFGNTSNPQSIRPLVVGGGNAGPTPYQVSLQFRGEHFCGGTIIDRLWVLTAAHCLDGLQPSQVRVFVGSTQLSHGGFRFSVSKLIRHPNYEEERAINDIGLLKLAGSFLWVRDRVGSIAYGKDFIQGGTEATVTGWGGTRRDGGPPSDKLQFLRLRVLDAKVCRRALFNYDDGHLCTFTRKGQGICGVCNTFLAVKDPRLYVFLLTGRLRRSACQWRQGYRSGQLRWTRSITYWVVNGSTTGLVQRRTKNENLFSSIVIFLNN
ncbi:chymotrypsin-1-like [Uranotaenia lowii]|uniref:chymotrypsin-1-like n=1 Tax=Uranotaenia lowii TaxID=190385 RepID=UPI00247872CB|nr:chymotrypsin-1-like [Uranotaenia lowii]